MKNILEEERSAIIKHDADQCQYEIQATSAEMSGTKKELYHEPHMRSFEFAAKSFLSKLERLLLQC